MHLAKDCTAVALNIRNNYQKIIIQKQIIKKKSFKIEQIKDKN